MLVFLFLACSSPEPEPPRPPDLVLVVVDTLRADRLGLYGHSNATSPNLDRIAADGMVFDRAYAHSSWTLASFASLYSGLLPHQHKAMRATNTEKDFGWLQPEAETIAELLKDQGYRTAQFSANTFLDRQFGLSQGFDYYNNDPTRSAADTTSSALEWLATGDEPAFLVVHWFEPHMSYDPDDQHRGRFARTDDMPITVPLQDHAIVNPWKKGEAPPVDTRDFVSALYDEEILSVDAAFEQLTNGLVDRWAQTRLIFTADHGEEFWDHGSFEHGHTLYSELTRVPLVVVGAGIPAGRTSTLVGHQDLYSTLVTWGGGSHRQIWEGQNWGGLDLMSLAQAELPGRSIMSESTLYGGEKVSLVKRTHRLVVDQRKGEYELLCMKKETLNEAMCAERGDAWKKTQDTMYQELYALRGNLVPVEHSTELRKTPDRNTTDQLKALGYLE
jgi:arylsulfatase A-like enzyme